MQSFLNCSVFQVSNHRIDRDRLTFNFSGKFEISVRMCVLQTKRHIIKQKDIFWVTTAGNRMNKVLLINFWIMEHEKKCKINLIFYWFNQFVPGRWKNIDWKKFRSKCFLAVLEFLKNVMETLWKRIDFGNLRAFYTPWKRRKTR